MIYYKEWKDITDNRSETDKARALLLYACRKEYGLHVLPTILYTEAGKPYFQEGCIYFNYSHSRSFVACGIDTEKIGVDVEEFRPLKETFIRKICHTREWEIISGQDHIQETAIMLWTMKEAYVKYKGSGIRERLSKIDFSELLLNNGNGSFLGLQMNVFKLKNGYLSVCSSHRYDLQYVAEEI